MSFKDFEFCHVCEKFLYDEFPRKCLMRGPCTHNVINNSLQFGCTKAHHPFLGCPCFKSVLRAMDFAVEMNMYFPKLFDKIVLACMGLAKDAEVIIYQDDTPSNNSPIHE